MAKSDFKIVDHMEEVLAELEKRKKAVLKGWGKTCETSAKKIVPVATGRLRNSITYKLENSETVIVGCENVEYAPKVEFDEHVKHKVGQAHFLRDGIIRTKDERESIAKNILG